MPSLVGTGEVQIKIMYFLASWIHGFKIKSEDGNKTVAGEKFVRGCG